MATPIVDWPDVNNLHRLRDHLTMGHNFPSSHVSMETNEAADAEHRRHHALNPGLLDHSHPNLEPEKEDQRMELVAHLVAQHHVRGRIMADMTDDGLVALHRREHPDPATYHEVDIYLDHTHTDADRAPTEKSGRVLEVDVEIPSWANYAVCLSYGDGEVRTLFKVQIAECVQLIEREAREKVLASVQILVKVGITPERKG